MEGKFTLNIITAYNGVEVISLTPSEYVHTKFDDIIADWRRQQLRESRRRREEELTFKGIIRKIIKLLGV
jgi:hypothetical protein